MPQIKSIRVCAFVLPKQACEGALFVYSIAFFWSLCDTFFMEHVLKNGKLYLIAVLMVAASLTWYAVAAEERSGVLTFAVLDVGQGDAIFIESPSGTQILVDGGPNGAVLREVGEVMPFYDRTLDL